MATARSKRRDKQLDELVQENSRLHKDIADLETAYLLHHQIVQDDQDSVRGIIRREVGGSRWEHGGEGKLKTYKSSKDLKERASNQTKTSSEPVIHSQTQEDSRERQAPFKSVYNVESQQYSRGSTKNCKKNGRQSDQDRRVKLVKENVIEKVAEQNGNQDRILDLKTKVLKKASSKVINRDTWASTNDTNSKIKSTESVIEGDKKITKLENENNLLTKSNKSNRLRRVNSLKRDSSKVDINAEENTKCKTLDSSLNRKNKTEGKNAKQSSLPDNVKQVERRSRLDLYESTDRKKNRPSAAASELQNEVVVMDAAKLSVSDKNETTDGRKIAESESKINGITYTPRKFDPLSAKAKDKPVSADYTPRQIEQLLSNTNNDSHIFQTQPAEATQIFIDPEHFQVRVKSGSDETFNDVNEMDTTKVLIQQVLHKSVDGSQKLPCTIVDNGFRESPPNEVRDIFGLGCFDARSANASLQGNSQNYGASASPFAAAKHCNTEVEFWLRGLGLADVDKYVNIFAENEIDLLDLEFMSAAQLHGMGVTALGALNKILKGVRDLKNVPKLTNSQKLNKKHLHASSIAWEAVDEAKIKKSGEDKLKNMASKTKHSEKSCPSETFMKQSSEFTGMSNSMKGVVRCSSVMSNRSDAGDSVTSSRTSNNGSFAASTKSSSAKCVEKRPPSAKMVVKTDTKNKSEGKVKRSNSNTSDKPVLKLVNLEAKPTKSVLLRPRSSSVTREGSRTQVKKGKKGMEEKESKGLGYRARSRSVDTATRKALEGVQAAAKKFENKQQRTKDLDMLNLKDEKKKLRRDEMAARHLQREKHKEVMVIHSSDSDNEDEKADNDDGGDGGLESLVTVNILSQTNSSDPDRSVRGQDDKGRTRSMATKSDVRKSLRRVEPVRKQQKKTIGALDTGIEPPLLSTYKLSNKDGDHDKSHSEPESGYRTDGSTYSQIEDRVAEIQRKIKRLKARATSGDEMTLTLVRDLQTQLQHFETQLTEKECELRGKRGPQNTRKREGDREREKNKHSDEDQGKAEVRQTERVRSSPRRSMSFGESSIESDYRSTPRPTQTVADDPRNRSTPRPTQTVADDLRNRSTPRSTQTVADDPRKMSTPRSTQTVADDPRNRSTPRPTQTVADDPRKHSPIRTILAEDVDVTFDKMKDKEIAGSETRMSKRELLDEMRKEKHQHHRQIRQLQSELQRIRHTDPVASLELDAREITYTEDDRIGEGTFSRVYKGNYQGAEVAIKCLKIPLQTQDRNYFAAEVSLLKELRHPRVVLLMGVCTNTKLPLMVLEYMSQGSLYNHLHNPESECLDHALYYQVARDIALGMNYLHSHKPEVLHLDLKSMNVLLCNGFRAKIADFGFSKLRHDAGQKSAKKVKSKNKPAASSPFWMAPELLDKGEVTGKADVYSFGIILWEMLTRKVPYNNCSIFQVLEMVRKNRRPEIPSVTPEGLTHLIQRCWSTNPARRPQFKDILQILENLSFPPAWRELFEQAGVPDEALHNVQSTRTIISLVTSTLDSSDQDMMHSFMLPNNNPDSQSRSVSAGEITLRELKTKTNSGRKTSSRDTSDVWECDTVSTLSERVSSDESEFTLKNLRESMTDDNCTDSSDNDDDSSVLTSDEDSTVIVSPSKKINTPTKTSNVDIPNLELKLQFARDEFKAEREKINRTNDWLSISLDDRSTYRSETEKSQRSSQDLFDVGQHALSNRSSTCGTPMGSEFGDSVHANEAARNKRRNKTKDLPLYSEEFLMRESFHNRRPPSPKKRTSLSKKLLNRSNSGSVDLCASTDASQSARSDNSLSLSLGNMSGGSAKAVPYVDNSVDSFFGISVDKGSQIQQNNNGENISMKDIATSDRSAFKTVVANEYRHEAEKTVKENYDMTSKIEDLLKDVGKDKKLEIVDDLSIDLPEEIVTDIATQNNCSDKEPMNSHTTELGDEDDSRHPFGKTSNSSDKKPEIENTNANEKDIVGKASYAGKQDTHEQTRRKSISLKDLSAKDTGETVKIAGSEQIRVQISSEVVKDNEDEQIRVKLNLEEVVEKKKPVITPRRSKMTVSDVKQEGKEIANASDGQPNVQTKPSEKIDLQKMVRITEPNLNVVKQDAVKGLPEISKLQHPVSEKPNKVANVKQERKPSDTKTSSSAEIIAYKSPRENQSLKSQSKDGLKKNTIRVKLRKDPLAPKLSAEPALAVPPPPPPPPPPMSLSFSAFPCSKSVQDTAPRSSMADELKLRLANRQSLSEGMKIVSRSKNTSKPVKKENVIGLHASSEPDSDIMQVAGSNKGEPRLVRITELDDSLVPQQSDGLPSFMVQSMDLRDQKDHLKSISRPHRDQQLDDLSNASKEKLSSIADILKKAVLGRRLAMREGTESVSQSLDSVATGWSVDTVT